MGGFNISGQTHALPAEAEEAKNHNVFAGGPPLWGRCDNPLARQLRSSSAQILAGWTKNVKSKKCKVLPSTPEGGPPLPGRAKRGRDSGGPPHRGWMEGLYIFWTSHFFGQPAKIWAALPRSARKGKKMGGFEVSLKNFVEHSFAFQEKLGVFEVSLKNFLNIASP